MVKFCAALPLGIVLLAGCGPSLDDDPTILGFTPELRAEMREVVRANDPDVDADQFVKDYMERMKKMAKAMNVQPNESGDYEFPKEALDEFHMQCTDSKDHKKLIVAMKKLMDDFEFEMPRWSRPILREEEEGTISDRRRELLFRCMLVEVFNGLVG